MAASSPTEVSTPLLRRLHRILQQQADLQGQARRGPMQLKAVGAAVVAAETEVSQAATALKKARMVSDEKQLQLQTREAHVADLNRKLNEAASNKEFTLLKEQIAADEQANSVQSDEIFEILERIDTLTGLVKEKEGLLAEAQAENEKRVAEIKQRQERVAADLARVEIQLEEAETEIPSVVKADWKRLIEARGEEAFAPIEGESCGGCSQTLTTQVASLLMLSKLTYCPNCNCILYLPEDRSV
ncbi:zinc ribbon domain-containing protein [Neorhodopirellula lusitana]|uniref:zinc ribbon domain-containing protein n=1 Tax=Neorhodopirellula lusitana TaxID=445327 RepID=UPI00384FD9C8